MDHFILQDTCTTLPYTGEGQGGGAKKRIQRDREAHGERLLRQLDAAWETNSHDRANVASVKAREGTYLEFRGAENCELVVKSLENVRAGIELLNVREETSDGGMKTQSATVFVPNGEEGFFNQRVQEYLRQNTRHNKPKNRNLVESIETIQLAVLSSFWIGAQEDIPGEVSVWCEFWLRTVQTEEADEANSFYEQCDRKGIPHKEKYIIFPEKAVVMAKTNRDDIQQIINENSHIAEIRRAPEANSFFTEMHRNEAEEWLTDLKARLTGDTSGSYVCILDTGVNYAHPLLEEVLSEEHAQSVEPAWGTRDIGHHGTEMAGVCEYFDLASLLESRKEVELHHRLESVKILQANGVGTDPELYGAATADAASLAEIANPQAKRVYCMAVTADKYAFRNGAPSSWSGELDNIISGVGDGIKKLFVVSAGNVLPEEMKEIPYPDVNRLHSVENPGQSWNAITVGAYTDKIQINTPGYQDWNPVADAGELSPFSSTSINWDGRKWPVKPEILMEGGNVITDGTDFDISEELSVLTTSSCSLLSPNLFTSINATSAATAQAAFMAAELMSRYPNLWEETIRALMIHSARWTEKMIEQFYDNGSPRTKAKNLLRCCGYGVADLDRAKESFDNSVNMVIQAEIQPYSEVGSKGKMNEMHLHEIPWPKEVLQSLGDTEVSMKVTLSYFIEPAPDQKGWNNRYRYASGALRFEVINKNQSLEDFKKRINSEMREDKKDKGAGDAGADRWFLGKENRDVGSIHSDIWTGPAVDLAESKYLAVYPVIGWWREREKLHRCNNTMRYALVISLSTPVTNTDFYTAIKTMIDGRGIATPIDIR